MILRYGNNCLILEYNLPIYIIIIKMDLIVDILFAAIILLICINDFTYYRISNSHVLSMIALYFTSYCLGFLNETNIFLTIFCAIISFIVLFILNQKDCIGGGDVKLIFALTFWVGANNMITYIFWITILGGVLALIYASAWAHIPKARRAVSSWIGSSSILKIFLDKRRVLVPKAENFFQYEIPYGIPLALGAMGIVFTCR